MKTIGPADLEIIRHRLEAINADACDTLVRVSGSQIASEANDVNTSLMTADGTVLAAGKYTMVLSTSLNFVVADILERYRENPGIRAGDQFITNDPYVATNHQPDVVVVAPIFSGERLVAWTGSVAHQVDIGGPVAGGYNYAARTIWEEAVPLAPMKIVEAGVMRRDIEREYLFRSRTPELNALDLLGQVAANRLATEHVLELCERYGAEELASAMERLIDSTETAFRRRLRELPDGVWRNNSYIEQAGLVDGQVLPNQVHAVRLTMRKQNDSLELDFTASSDQAPGPINCTRPALSNYTMAAVLAYLCQGLAWVPGAVFRAIRIRTRSGSIVAPRWPAPVAMSASATGQAVRICTSTCIARMLDASEAHRDKAMASCQSTGALPPMSGLDAGGRAFNVLLLDDLTGGGGASAHMDGVDSSGTLTAPGALSANIEATEAYFPVMYRSRRELPDSGGPGRRRGGVGSYFALLPHNSPAPIALTPKAQGLQHPSALGIAGGEPGTQSGIAFAHSTQVGPDPNWEKVAAQVEVGMPALGQKLSADQAMVFSSQGGGGYGDPLERDPAAVLDDVREGLVSVVGSRRDYGVVVRTKANEVALDELATEALRDEMRRHRLRGKKPLARTHSPAGRRLSSHLEALDSGSGQVVCSHCGTRICPAGVNLFEHLLLREAGCGERFVLGERYEGSERFCVRHYYCPGCATQVDVQIALRGEPLLEAMQAIQEPFVKHSREAA